MEKANFLFSNVAEPLIFFKLRKIFCSKRWCAPNYQKDYKNRQKTSLFGQFLSIFQKLDFFSKRAPANPFQYVHIWKAHIIFDKTVVTEKSAQIQIPKILA